MLNDNNIIDITQLTYSDDQEFLDEYIHIFEGSAEKLISRLRASLKNSNAEFKDVVHTIKGLSSNIGANNLRELTTSAEKLSDADYENSSEEHFVRIEKELEKVKLALVKCASKPS